MPKLKSTSKGRIGGVLVCALLVGLLGGVASGAPGHADRPTTTSPSNEGSGSPEVSDEEGADDQAGAKVPAHSAADCSARLSDIQTTVPPADQATGLAHAIRVVEGNCEKNLQAPGLVIALSHLVTNFQRHLAHEADKAAGVHGNSADHGHSADHGDAATHGSGAHGS
jgi:hypothetical protein